MKNCRLPVWKIYMRLAPCLVYMETIIKSLIRGLFLGTPAPKGGERERVMVFPFGQFTHSPEVKGEVLEGKSSPILQKFFDTRR